MRRKVSLWMLVVFVTSLVLLPVQPALSLVGPAALLACESAGFSTEEDFISHGPEPSDGNPRISDGDLLSADGAVCARNADLLAVFQPRTDLGLDAVDIIDARNYMVAFSTELDDPGNRFTAGDLIGTNGAVLPNAALVGGFGVGHDIGLDEVKFIGTISATVSFLAEVRERGRDYWTAGRLQDALKRRQLDLWFSTEGDWNPPTGAPGFLDGDILSAASASIVVNQATLLPASVPAGIPARGVDFGLDAFAVPRNGDRERIYFSTEILYEDPDPVGLSFTDGDVLRFGNGVVAVNWSLIQDFKPAARDLGLDALFVAADQPPPTDPNIQTMCGDRPVADFDGGLVPIGGPGDGLYRANSAMSPPGDPPRRPCGRFVPIDGYLPATGIDRFRVAYRDVAAPAPAVGTAAGVRTNWVLWEWHGWPINACLATGSLSTDANGWMDASDYLAAKSGTLTGCANSHLRLAVWDTDNLVGFGPPNKNGHYRLWLEWEDGGLHREPLEHHLQLDNVLPTIAPFPNGLQVRLPDGTTIVPACGEAPKGASQFQVWGQFDDAYYWRFSLVVRGGVPPTSVGYGPHNYWDPTDGTVGVKNTNDTGTTPNATTVRLRDINMTDLGASFVDCCYLLDLYVWDASIRHEFGGLSAVDNSGSYYANTFITFAAAP